MLCPKRVYFAKYTKSLYNSLTTTTKKVKKRAEDLIDISPKKTYRWPTGT